MIKMGEYNTLLVVKDTQYGLFLADEEYNEVLLPGKYVPAGVKIGDELTVFVYRDSGQRPVATTLVPKITLGEYACLTVKQSTQVGAFLDWGLEKDLLVPFEEQQVPMVEGRRYVVHLYLDAFTDRLVASSRLKRFLNNDELTVAEGDLVDLIVIGHVELGVQVIVNNAHTGLVYKSELYKPLKPGDVLEGYVKTVRPDNKLDITLQKQGYEAIEPNAEAVLEKLKRRNGFLALGDHSSPEEISAELQMSKKAFKRAIGVLFKQRRVRIEEDGIHLV